MLTLFTIPKPFAGRSRDIQLNALRSWTALPDVEIVLVGGEHGVAEAAHEHGVGHVNGLLRSERGTPRVDDAFARVDAVASHRLRCFVNCDIVLLDDFLPAVAAAQRFSQRSLLVGTNLDLDVPPGLDLASERVRERLRAEALARGTTRGYAALDWFVFPAGHFDPMPPFLVGRACYDNWLVWKARQVGPVIDASRAIVVVHQSHGYEHVPGGMDEAYYGEEAKHNERLAGGRSHIYTLYDASHRMRPDRSIHRYPGSVLRSRERVRAGLAKSRAKLGRS